MDGVADEETEASARRSPGGRSSQANARGAAFARGCWMENHGPEFFWAGCCTAILSMEPARPAPVNSADQLDQFSLALTSAIPRAISWSATSPFAVSRRIFSAAVTAASAAAAR